MTLEKNKVLLNVFLIFLMCYNASKCALVQCNRRAYWVTELPDNDRYRLLKLTPLSRTQVNKYILELCENRTQPLQPLHAESCELGSYPTENWMESNIVIHENTESVIIKCVINDGATNNDEPTKQGKYFKVFNLSKHVNCESIITAECLNDGERSSLNVVSIEPNTFFNDDTSHVILTKNFELPVKFTNKSHSHINFVSETSKMIHADHEKNSYEQISNQSANSVDIHEDEISDLIHILKEQNRLTQNFSYSETYFDASQEISDEGKNSSNSSESSSVDAVNPEPLLLPGYLRWSSTVVICLILFIGVVGNMLVPAVVLAGKRSTPVYFMTNLAVSDLLVLLVCLPTVLVELHTTPESWVLGPVLCE